MAIMLIMLAETLTSQDNALSLDGGNDYVEVLDNNLLDFGNNDFTIEIWVRKNRATIYFNDTYIVSKWIGVSAGDEWTLTAAAGENDDLPRFIIDDSGMRYTVISSTPLTIGQWHHLSAVRDGDFLRIYLDGSLKGTTYCGSATVNNAGTNLRIGNNSPGSPFGNYYSNIDVDELRIWNHARSEAQIASNLNTTLPPNSSGLIAYYRFNQGSAGGNNPGETTLWDGTTNALHGTLYDFALSGSSSNWIGSLVALPIELLEFNVKAAATANKLAWRTASEQYNKGFHIQRSSDGTDWCVIGFVPGAGNSTEERHYQLTDRQPLHGHSYYRLLQEDEDGKTTLSDIRHVFREETSGYAVFPNPADRRLTLRVQESDAPIQARLRNSAGQIVLQQSSATHLLEFDIEALPAGIYWLEWDCRSGACREKVVVQHKH